MSKMSPFVIVQYIADLAGKLLPLLPAQCLRSEKNYENCEIVIHSWRSRKTGPCFELAIIHCKTHGGYTTLYPPGYGKYLRLPLVQVSPSGQPIHSDEDEDRLHCEFQGTKFEAALDAAEGKAWDRDVYSTSGYWWQTQCRYLDECCRLLGLHPEQKEQRLREKLAHIIGIPLFILEQERSKIVSKPGYRSRGCGIVRVLDKLQNLCIVERLAFAGYLAGLWGCPYWLAGSSRQLTPAPFQGPGTHFKDFLWDEGRLQ
jgi:hypothetical protein